MRREQSAMVIVLPNFVKNSTLPFDLHTTLIIPISEGGGLIVCVGN